MAMQSNGLAKLTEEIGELQKELGELQQVIGKMLGYPDLQSSDIENHPDGTNLRKRLVEEMADVHAAIEFVTVKLNLQIQGTQDRIKAKLHSFRQWDVES